MQKSKSQSGITLPELLIILGVIAVLLVIFYPIFHPYSREKARHASCQSNLKQLGLAFIQYTAENDNTYPAGRNSSGQGWAGQLYSYVKADGIYHCPDDTLQGEYNSYAENALIVRQPVELFLSPAVTVELYEFSTPSCDPSLTSPPESVSAVGISAPSDSTRHGETYELNFLSADGHVKFLAPIQISNGAGAMSPKKIGVGSYVLTFAVK